MLVNELAVAAVVCRWSPFAAGSLFPQRYGGVLHEVGTRDFDGFGSGRLESLVEFAQCARVRRGDAQQGLRGHPATRTAARTDRSDCASTERARTRTTGRCGPACHPCQRTAGWHSNPWCSFVRVPRCPALRPEPRTSVNGYSGS